MSSTDRRAKASSSKNDDSDGLVVTGKRRRRTVNRLVMSVESESKQRYGETMYKAGRGSSLGTIRKIGEVFRYVDSASLKPLYRIIYDSVSAPLAEMRTNLRAFSGLSFDEDNESEMDALQKRMGRMGLEEMRVAASVLCINSADLSTKDSLVSAIIEFLMEPGEEKCVGEGPVKMGRTSEDDDDEDEEEMSNKKKRRKSKRRSAKKSRKSKGDNGRDAEQRLAEEARDDTKAAYGGEVREGNRGVGEVEMEAQEETEMEHQTATDDNSGIDKVDDNCGDEKAETGDVEGFRDAESETADVEEAHPVPKEDNCGGEEAEAANVEANDNNCAEEKAESVDMQDFIVTESADMESNDDNCGDEKAETGDVKGFRDTESETADVEEAHPVPKEDNCGGEEANVEAKEDICSDVESETVDIAVKEDNCGDAMESETADVDQHQGNCGDVLESGSAETAEMDRYPEQGPLPDFDPEEGGGTHMDAQRDNKDKDGVSQLGHSSEQKSN